MLHEILNIQVKNDDFVRIDESGKKWLTTEMLPSLLQDFRTQVEDDRNKEDKTEIFERRNIRIRNCLSLSRSVWLKISELKKNPLSGEVSLGIHILANTLQFSATEICGLGRGLRYPTEISNQPGYREVPWKTDRTWQITRNPFISQRMIAQGWCPSVVDQIRDNFKVLGQYYVSLLGPPKRKLDHSNSKKENRDCDAVKSFKGGYDKHLTAGCQCKMINVDRSSLEEIIKKSEIPVLCFDEETASLEVISSKSVPKLEYTAMSHVWTDGWGNPDENSLSSCRLHQLVRWIKGTYKVSEFSMPSSSPSTLQPFPPTAHIGKFYFWIDTLCVPRHPEEIHKRAVMQMRNVYTEAERVLVLDSEILASSIDASYEELNMRIQCSRWIRRLWTLQEAVLTKKLFFQFAERAVIISVSSPTWHVRQIDLRDNFYNSIDWDCYTAFETYAAIRSRDFRVDFFWRTLLINRSVTIPSDEPICGAIMMDFDMEYLMLGSDGDERMQRFWEMHENHVPVPILFVPGSRLRRLGFRWAPDSIFRGEETGPDMEHLGAIAPYNQMRNQTIRGIFPSKCLTVRFPAYRAFLLESPKEAVTISIPIILDRRKYFIERRAHGQSPDLWNLCLHTRRNLAMIIEMTAEQDRKGSWAFDGYRAALVSVVHRDSVRWTVEYLRQAIVVQEGSDYHLHPNWPFPEKELEEMARTPVAAEWIEKELEWRIL